MANEREVENNCIVVHENENNLMEESLRFAVREGGHTVGAGVVTQILE